MDNRELSAIQDNLATARYLVENAHGQLEKQRSGAKEAVLDAFELIDGAINCISQELKTGKPEGG